MVKSERDSLWSSSIPQGLAIKEVILIIYTMYHVNLLPNNKILALTKLKAFADHKFNVAKMMISGFHLAENIVRKGGNAGYQHFLLFLHCSHEAISSGTSEVISVW